jgi:uncharacterized protein (DUF2236 family)
MAADANEDTGLFGPESVTWRLHAEPILWLAGLRALLLQMLLPRALAGVLQNSNFREDPWGRLLRTAQFYGEVVYGPTARAEQAGARVRRLHAAMSGTDLVTGERFRIDEPDLLRWVHVTEVDSYAETARRAGLRLTGVDWDGYWAEQRRRAALVGLDPAGVPGSRGEVADYFRSVRPQLRMTRDAAETLRFLSWPPAPPWQPAPGWRSALARLGGPPLRLAGLGVAAAAFALLPPWARRLYGAFGLPTGDLAATVSARTLRIALNTLPHRVYEGPIYQAAMTRAEAAR